MPQMKCFIRTDHKDKFYPWCTYLRVDPVGPRKDGQRFYCRPYDRLGNLLQRKIKMCIGTCLPFSNSRYLLASLQTIDFPIPNYNIVLSFQIMSLWHLLTIFFWINTFFLYHYLTSKFLLDVKEYFVYPYQLSTSILKDISDVEKGIFNWSCMIISLLQTIIFLHLCQLSISIF